MMEEYITQKLPVHEFKISLFYIQNKIKDNDYLKELIKSEDDESKKQQILSSQNTYKIIQNSHSNIKYMKKESLNMCFLVHKLDLPTFSH